MNEMLATVHADCSLPRLALAGLALRTTNAEAAQTIGPLWQRVAARDLLRTLPGARPLVAGTAPPLVALYSDYEGDHTAPYTITVGVLIDAAAAAAGAGAGAAGAAGLVRRVIPAQRYARVDGAGPPIAAAMSAWARVWRDLTPRRAFTADLEVHAAGDGPVSVYVALR